MGNLTPTAIDAVADQIFSTWSADEIRRVAEGNRFLPDHIKYGKYQSDPVGFIENELGGYVIDDMRKVCESVRDNQITVVRSCNGPGKTWIGGKIIPWFYKSFEEAKVYLTAAGSQENLKDLLWGELANTVRKNRHIFENDYITTLRISDVPPLSSKADEGDEQETAARLIRGLSIPNTDIQARFSGKHSKNMLFVVDEGDAVPSAVYAGIESCMSGGNNKLLILFNPRVEKGEPYLLEKDARANVIEVSAFNHPNVIQGHDIIPGAVSCDKTVQRINKYCRRINPNERPDESCFKLPKFLEYVDAPREKGGRYDPLEPGYYKVMEQVFWTLVLGRYPQMAEDQLISKDWINAARDRWDIYVQQNGEMPPANSYGIQGVDVGEMGPDPSVLCHRYGGYVERPLVSHEKLDPLEVADWAADEAHRRRIKQANADGNGVGAGTAPQMVRRGVLAVGIKVQRAPTTVSELGDFKIMRDQLLWAVRMWLRNDPFAMLPPCPELIEELSILTYAVVGGKVRVMTNDVLKDILKRSGDYSAALYLTFADEVQGQASTGGQVSDKAKQKAALRKQAMRV